MRWHWIFCAFLMILVAPAYSASESTEPSENAKQLTALWRNFAPITTEEKVSQEIQKRIPLLVQEELAKVDQGNRAWNKENPNWGKLESIIQNDANAYITKFLSQSIAMRKPYDQVIANNYDRKIGSEGIQYLLEFYQSPHGKKYLMFSKEISTTLESCMKKMADMQQKQEHIEFTKSSEKVVMARLNLMLKNVDFRFLESKSEADVAAHRPTSWWGGVSEIVLNCSVIKGEELDSIGKKIAEDMPSIEEYINSEYAKQELAIYVAQSNQITEQLKPDYSAWLESQRESWQKTYTELEY